MMDAELTSRIQRHFDDSRGTYGSPRIHHLLKREGIRTSPKRVVRLMQQAGLRARAARIYRRAPGLKSFASDIPNRLPASTTAPNQVWVADITYLKLCGRWRFLAAVMDKHSRRIIGWSLDRNRMVPLTIAALENAVTNRRPAPGLIFHTDHGTEFAAYAFRDRLRDLGFVQSMNRRRQMNDNAHMESFFHSLKSEELHARTFQKEPELKAALRSYIQRYNRFRPHSALGYQSPIDFEQRAA